LASFWPHLKLAGLKKCVWPFGSFLAFFALIGAYLGKYCYSIFSATHLQNVCDKCYIRRPHSDISNS